MVTWYVFTKDHGGAAGWTIRYRESSIRTAERWAAALRLEGWETQVRCYR